MTDRLDIDRTALGMVCEEHAHTLLLLNPGCNPCPDGMSRQHPDCLMWQDDYPINAACNQGGACWYRHSKHAAYELIASREGGSR